MTRYRVIVPYLRSMGSISPFVVSETPMETRQQQALWQINRMREHDGLQPYPQLPPHVRFERISD